MSSLLRVVAGALLLFVAFFLFWQLQFFGIYYSSGAVFYKLLGYNSAIVFGVAVALATSLSAWECWLIVRWRRQLNRSRARQGLFGPRPPADERRASQVSG